MSADALPPVPACHGQFGNFRCAPKCNLACKAARVLYIFGQYVADKKTDAERHYAIREFTAMRGADAAQRIKAAAKHLLTVAAQAAPVNSQASLI